MATFKVVAGDDGTWSVALPELPGGAYDISVVQATCGLVSRPTRAVLLIAPATAIVDAPAITTPRSDPEIVVTGRPGLTVDTLVVSDTGEVVAEGEIVLGSSGTGLVPIGDLDLGGYVVRVRGRTDAHTTDWIEATLTIISLRLLSTEDGVPIATAEEQLVAL